MVGYLLVKRIDLLHGTLDLMILQTLRWGPQHGHGIGQAIRTSSRDAFQVEHGSLYPALHRLERKGWIAAKWERSGKDQEREFKFYRLTPAGRKQLTAEESKWLKLTDAISRIIRPAEEG